MQKGNNKVCPVCGKVCRSRGIGAHMRLQHGVKLKTLISHISDSSDSSDHISELSGHISDSSDHISELSEARVQRPSDFVKKNEVVVETRKEWIDTGWYMRPAGKELRDVGGNLFWDGEFERYKEYDAEFCVKVKKCFEQGKQLKIERKVGVSNCFRNNDFICTRSDNQDGLDMYLVWLYDVEKK